MLLRDDHHKPGTRPRWLFRQTGFPEPNHSGCLCRRGGRPTLRAGPEDFFVLVNKKASTDSGAMVPSTTGIIWHKRTVA